MIRVLLVDDHASFRQALEGMISLEADLEVVGHVGRGDLAGKAAEAQRPDVAVVDLDLPGAGGVDAMADIRDASPGTRCVVLTALVEPVELGRAVEGGAAAVLHKSVQMAQVFDVIRAVASGKTMLDPERTVAWLRALHGHRETRWQARAAEALLSPREQEVLELLAQGLGTRAIAQQLFISEGTAQTHVRNLRVKLGAGTRLEAVAEALRLGLLKPP